MGGENKERMLAVMTVIMVIGLLLAIVGGIVCWVVGVNSKKWINGFGVLALGLLMILMGDRIIIHITKLDMAAEKFQVAKIEIERKLKESGSTSAIDEAQELNQQLEEMIKADFMHCTKVMNCTPIKLDVYLDIEETGPQKAIRYQCLDCEKQFYIEKRMQEELPSGFPVCPCCGGNQVEQENFHINY